MILASGEGQLIFVVVMAVIGVINWLAGKLKAPDQPPPKNLPPGSRPAPPDSEEERMRRFLEALGLPSDTAPPQRTKSPPVAAPKPPPLTQARAPKRSVATPPPFHEQALPRPAVQAPAIGQSIERMAFPEPVLQPMPEFDTVASRISAIPSELSAARTAVPAADDSNVSAAVRRMLASPRDIRTAFILREVLGPAPGLPT